MYSDLKRHPLLGLILGALLLGVSAALALSTKRHVVDGIGIYDVPLTFGDKAILYSLLAFSVWMIAASIWSVFE